MTKKQIDEILADAETTMLAVNRMVAVNLRMHGITMINAYKLRLQAALEDKPAPKPRKKGKPAAAAQGAQESIEITVDAETT